jgi:hypothetical protein
MLDDSFALYLNAHHEPTESTLPPTEFGAERRIVVDAGATFANLYPPEIRARVLAAEPRSTVDAVR